MVLAVVATVCLVMTLVLYMDRSFWTDPRALPFLACPVIFVLAILGIVKISDFASHPTNKKKK